MTGKRKKYIKNSCKMKLPEESLQFILSEIIDYANDRNKLSAEDGNLTQDFIDGVQAAYQEIINVIRNEIENRGYTVEDLGFKASDIPDILNK